MDPSQSQAGCAICHLLPASQATMASASTGLASVEMIAEAPRVTSTRPGRSTASRTLARATLATSGPLSTGESQATRTTTPRRVAHLSSVAQTTSRIAPWSSMKTAMTSAMLGPSNRPMTGQWGVKSPVATSDHSGSAATPTPKLMFARQMFMRRRTLARSPTNNGRGSKRMTMKIRTSTRTADYCLSCLRASTRSTMTICGGCRTRMVSTSSPWMSTVSSSERTSTSTQLSISIQLARTEDHLLRQACSYQDTLSWVGVRQPTQGRLCVLCGRWLNNLKLRVRPLLA